MAAMNPRLLFLRVIALGCGLVCAAASAQTVELILSEDTGVYVEVADVLRHEFAGRVELKVLSAAAAARGDKSDAQLVIAVGVQGFEAAMKVPAKAPVLGTLLPRAAYERVARSAEAGAHPSTAIYLDQSAGRQLDLVRVLVPDRQKIGFLVSPASAESVAPFRSAARDRKLTIVEEPIQDGDDLYAALRRLLVESDAVIALPDSAVFNAGSIINILITTYRAQEPLFGFSPAYVKAGALAAVYSTPRQIALQAAEAAQRFLSGSPLPPPQYPKQFSVAVNPTVAHSLGLVIEDEATVLEKLQKMEHE
jgi:putative ABC transport system substrate-binding protein